MRKAHSFLLRSYIYKLDKEKNALHFFLCPVYKWQRSRPIPMEVSTMFLVVRTLR